MPERLLVNYFYAHPVARRARGPARPPLAPAGLPFRSVLPDTERYPAFTQLAPAAIVDDGDEGPRTPSMTCARIRDDLDRIVAAAGELLRGTLTYEHALRDYFAELPAALGGDPAAIWSIDGVHRDYVPQR
jgi:hypothetical protein